MQLSRLFSDTPSVAAFDDAAHEAQCGGSAELDALRLRMAANPGGWGDEGMCKALVYKLQQKEAHDTRMAARAAWVAANPTEAAAEQVALATAKVARTP